MTYFIPVFILIHKVCLWISDYGVSSVQLSEMLTVKNRRLIIIDLTLMFQLFWCHHLIYLLFSDTLSHIPCVDKEHLKSQENHL